MNKKDQLILTLVIVVFIVSLCWCMNYYQELHQKQLPGQFIINDVEGMELIDFSTGDKYMFLPDYYIADLAYSNERGKAVVYIQFSDLRDGIYEYDFKTKQLEFIIDAEKIPDYQFGYIKYVPRKNAISYMLSDSLYIYNLDTKERTCIINDVGLQYSWSNDGNYLLYSSFPSDQSDSYIYKYNFVTKQTDKLDKGYDPVYSQDNKYIAYTVYNGGNYRLVVKDISSGNYDWYNDDGYYNYVFSPDGQYLAVTRINNASLSNLADASSIYDTYIWEFSAGVLPEKILTAHGNQRFAWDYISFDQ